MPVKKSTCLAGLLALLIQLVLGIATLAQAQPAVGHWRFNDASGTTTTDSTGSGHTAILLNGPLRGTGIIGGGISANAALRQSVIIPPVDLSRTNAVTVALWAKRTYTQLGGHVLFEASNDYNNSTTGFVFLPDDATCQGVQLAIRGDVGYTASCYNQPTSQVWHHLAVVFDKSQTGGNAVMFYVDGVLQTPTRSLYASTNTNNFGDQPIYLFSRGGVTQFDSGTIDDLRIYSRALPAAQVQQIQQAGLSQIGKDVVVSVDGTGTMTTPSFTTSVNGELLVAFVAYDGPTGTLQTATVSGGGLTWKLVERSNGQLGTSEIWTATAPNSPFTATVTASPGSGGSWHGIATVVGFTNASGTGIVGKASAPTGAADVKLTGVSAGNWVYAVGNDWDNPIARTPISGQVLVHQRVDTQIGDTCWVQSTAAPSTISGTVDIHDNAPITDRWNYAAIEILAKQGTTYSISGTISGVGGPGATVNLTGAKTASTTANTAGSYSFTGLANGSYTVTPSKSGFSYTPASKAVTVNGANVTGLSFTSTAVAHWVALSWTASTSPVVGYNIYRSNISGGPYTKLNSSLVSSTTYSDSTVQSGYTYYYATTAVDKYGNESAYSNQAIATVP